MEFLEEVLLLDIVNLEDGLHQLLVQHHMVASICPLLWYRHIPLIVRRTEYPLDNLEYKVLVHLLYKLQYLS